jgi:hypothetical protein
LQEYQPLALLRGELIAQPDYDFSNLFRNQAPATPLHLKKATYIAI